MTAAGKPTVAADGAALLAGSRCPACGAAFFPPRQVCSRCLGELEEAPLSARGTVYTHTVVHQSAPAFETPYTLVYVDLPEGVRVLGQLAGEARIGMEVELEPDERLGFRFRPVGEGS